MKKSLGFALAMFFLAASPVKAGATEVGNKICPVSGDKVSGRHFLEYEGRKIALCCAHCEKDFKKDPAKYLAQLESGAPDPHAGGEQGHSEAGRARA